MTCQPSCQLLPGNCMDVSRFESDRFAAIVVDPPYSSGGAFRSDRARPTSRKYRRSDARTDRRDFAGDNRDGRSWGSWATLWLAECLRVAEPGAYLLCFADWRQLPTATDAVQWGGWTWRGILVWDKGGSARGPSKHHFRHQAEFIVWATKGPFAGKSEGGPWPGVLRHTVKHKADKFHEAGKPTDLMLDLLRCVRPGGEVLDPTCGSGTTLAAARQLGLPSVGIELDPDELQNADRRLFGPRGLAV